MILRRVIDHFRKQEWTAIVIDFVIVVLGVFVGLQVNNWNEARREQLSEAQYLERFAEEIALTLQHIQNERAFGESSIDSIELFADRLYRSGVSDEDLMSSAADYFSEGAFFAKFNPNRTTFDDLITTGNFDIIREEGIRTSLIKLHALYTDAKDTLEGNIDWAQQGEAHVYYTFDAFRFDRRTQKLFGGGSADNFADEIRQNRDLLRRHAGFHYWIKVRSIELYDQVEPQARAALELINAELEARS